MKINKMKTTISIQVYFKSPYILSKLNILTFENILKAINTFFYFKL